MTKLNDTALNVRLNKRNAKDNEQKIRMMIAHNLVAARTIAKMRQTDVMQKLYPHSNCKNTNRISEYESGYREVAASVLIKFCRLYQVSADFILGFSSEFDLQETAIVKSAGYMYQGMFEIAHDSVERMTDYISKMCAKFISKAPTPSALCVIDAAKMTLKAFRDNKLQLDDNTKEALSRLANAIRDYDCKQANQMQAFEMGFMSIQDDEGDFAKHCTQSEIIKNQYKVQYQQLALDVDVL